MSPEPASSRAWNRRARFALLVALINLVAYNGYQVFYGYQAIRLGFSRPDFAYFYAFARAGLLYGDHRLFEPTLQAQVFHALFPGAPWYPVVNPPPFAWLLAPLAVMPYPVALAAWTITAVASIGLSCWLLSPEGRYGRIVFAASWLGFLPAYLVFVSAPVAPLVVLSLALAWRAVRSGHQGLAGAALAIGLVKPTLAVLVPFALLAAGHRRLFVSWLAAGICFVLASYFALGPSGTDGYLAMTASFAKETYSLRWSLVPIVGDGVPWLIAVALIAALTALTAWWLRADAGAAIAIGVAASFLVNHHATPGDLMMLLVPAWLVARSSGAVYAPAAGAFVWAAAWIGVIFPLCALLAAASVPVFLVAGDLLAGRRIELRRNVSPRLRREASTRRHPADTRSSSASHEAQPAAYREKDRVREPTAPQ